ncbi:SLC13 family permease [Blattabacterium cuenoti]|uniref:SLC13 family permease n=1 Tax=Blattabacterium cuenoti TaxID=1653831 RepID=UPI00163BF4BC|nr:SLC13 family permease [Blattabacterium cuenoti]
MIILIFIIGYLFIIIENFIKLNKFIPSLIMASICWGLIIFFKIPVFELDKNIIQFQNSYNLLLFHLGKASEIIFFLIGAMSIISIMDMYSSFESLINLFTVSTKRKFLWIINIISFTLSAVIDNLTATIVVITILKKIIRNYKERLYYIGLILISANAGGVWSPIGDITTTMLWISNKVTTINLIKKILIPSILCMCISTYIGSKMSIFNGKIKIKKSNLSKLELRKGFFLLQIGLFFMLLVPIMKTLIGIPPYMGMMLSFSIFCLITNIFFKKSFFIEKIFKKIDFSSILFFLGILLSISSLEVIGKLYYLSNLIIHMVSTWKITTFILGLISSFIDNVPLVAATIAMFSYSIDHEFWHFIAYVSGTGGSIFIIGSSSGIAAMGMEKIDFFWYLKKISFVAFIGYLFGYLYLIIF